MVLRHHAGLEYLQRHIGGIGSELGVVDAAGGKCAVADEGIGPGIVGHARLNEGLGNGQLHGHHAVVGGGKDGVRLACQAGRGGNDLIRVDTGTLHIGDSLGIQVFLGLGNGRLGIRLRGGVQQAHGLNIRVLGKHHVQNKGGVQSVAGAGDPVDAGESRGGGVADGGVDDGGAQVLGGIDHALRRQGGDGDHGVIALAGHLGADLVEQALVILAVELRIVDGDAQLRRLGVQLGFHRLADLVQGGVVQLLNDGDLIPGHPLSGGLGGVGGRGSGGTGAGAAGGEGQGQRGGGGQRHGVLQIQLFHCSFLLF